MKKTIKQTNTMKKALSTTLALMQLFIIGCGNKDPICHLVLMDYTGSCNATDKDNIGNVKKTSLFLSRSFQLQFLNH